MSYPNGWITFLNQYYWLQNYVDQQVGRVLTALASSSYAAKTVIIFASDHGEYGGSHGLHDKGCAVHDEAIRVPLYVKYPKMTSSITMSQMVPVWTSLDSSVTWLRAVAGSGGRPIRISHNGNRFGIFSTTTPARRVSYRADL